MIAKDTQKYRNVQKKINQFQSNRKGKMILAVQAARKVRKKKASQHVREWEHSQIVYKELNYYSLLILSIIEFITYQAQIFFDDNYQNRNLCNTSTQRHFTQDRALDLK